MSAASDCAAAPATFFELDCALEIALVVATEVGRDIAGDGRRDFVAGLRTELGREPTVDEVRDAACWARDVTANFMEEHACARGATPAEAALVRQALVEGFDARMNGGAQ